MDFCYLVQRDVLDVPTLDEVDATVDRFHADRVVFKDAGIRNNFSLPRQHAMKHF
jgi:hypothetical protein